MEQRHKRRSREPKRFSSVQQSSLFGKEAPDARLVGTLLHTLVNMLHERNGPLTKEKQEAILADTELLVHMIQSDAVSLLQQAGKFNLAMFFDGLRQNDKLLNSTVIAPMVLYQRELIRHKAEVLAAAERFQFKLLSTGKTFVEHRDWGGQVTFVGEFDQVRLHKIGTTGAPQGVPAIVEFKKGLSAKNQPVKLPATLFEETGSEEREPLNSPTLPGMSHAMQLMVYWMAFQTRWNVFDEVIKAKGMLEEIRMPVQQQLDLVIYNLNDGYQHQLIPIDFQEMLTALANCIFFLNWALKSGFSRHSPEHDCKKTQLVEPPDTKVEVGTASISARECYLLAKEAFERFKAMVRWEVFPPG